MKAPVVIIGGGISGLTAATRLQAHGIPIAILEAKPRLGGRIHTIWEGPLPIELGAEFIHGRSPALLSAIRKSGLPTRSVPDRHCLFGGGKTKSVDLFGLIAKVIGRVKLRKPDLSFQRFLDEHEFDARSRQLALDYVEGFNAAHADKASSHALVRAQYAADQMHGSWQGRITRGYSALVDHLERGIRRHGGVILQEALAKRVNWKPGLVEVVFFHRGKRRTTRGSAAIITLPLGIWKAGRVHFAPALTDKQAAANDLQFGNVAKLIFVFDRKWWSKSDASFIHAPGELLPTWWTSPQGPLVTGWAGGPKADCLAEFPLKRLKTIGLDLLSKIFSERRAGLASQLTAFHAHKWAHDPHILGAYSYVPVNGLDLPKVLSAPRDGTLFFAGEATVHDAQTGTIFGALESGLRAANEIICDQPD